MVAVVGASRQTCTTTTWCVPEEEDGGAVTYRELIREVIGAVIREFLVVGRHLEVATQYLGRKKEKGRRSDV